MIHYFATLTGLATILLLLATWAGLAGSPQHLYLGLSAAITAGATHSLVILFSIVSGRVLREAIRARKLDGALLDELNEFFAKKSAYPAALFAVLFIATAAVLGFANYGFGLNPMVHMIAGFVALIVNLWAFSVEGRAILANQDVLDRAAARLDELDRIARDEGEDVEYVDAEPLNLKRVGWSLTLGSWLPYLYQVLILWKGDFGRVSIHPWLEGSLLGLWILFLATRESRRIKTAE